MNGFFELRVSGSFSSAHALRAYKGKCEHIHGHNWNVALCVRGTELDEAGLLVDFSDLRGVLRSVLEELDHKYLNEDVERFRSSNPSAEEIARFVAEQAAGALPSGVEVAWVEVEETPGSGARFVPGPA